MRTRTLITGAAFLLVGTAAAGKAHAQALSLRGSDTLDLVSTDVIANSPLVLTGVPSQFIPCSADTACASFGTTCDTVHQYCVVGGTLLGCTAAQGCLPDGTYTFDNGNGNAADDWQDVLRQIYGGMN